MNHLNPAYLEEGPVRERFANAFSGSVTAKSEVKRGRQPTTELAGTFQGGLERSFSGSGDALIEQTEPQDITRDAQAIEVALASGSYREESEDIILSPRHVARASSSAGLSSSEGIGVELSSKFSGDMKHVR